MLRAAHSMINPGQFVLELILVVAALALSRSLAGKTTPTLRDRVRGTRSGGELCLLLLRGRPALSGARVRSVWYWPAQSPSRRFGGVFLPSSCPGSPHACRTLVSITGFTLRQNPDRAGSVLGIGIAVGVVVTATFVLA